MDLVNPDLWKGLVFFVALDLMSDHWLILLGVGV